MSKTRDPILAYAVEIKSVEGDTVRGDLIELDYAAQCGEDAKAHRSG